MPRAMRFLSTVAAAILYYSAHHTLAAVPASQKQALIDLYDATNGPYWRYGPNVWNFSSDPCEDNWYFIKCNENYTSVM